jgi:hypothetical protein
MISDHKLRLGKVELQNSHVVPFQAHGISRVRGCRKVARALLISCALSKCVCACFVMLDSLLDLNRCGRSKTSSGQQVDFDLQVSLYHLLSVDLDTCMIGMCRRCWSIAWSESYEGC